MEKSKSFKFKKSLIISIMLSIMIAISALCISLIPSVNQNVYAADLADSIDVSTGKLPGVVGGSGKWEGIAVKSGNVITEIGDAQQLADFAASVNGGANYSNITVYLTADIDLSEKIWTPIGIDTANYFKGTFDGRGHKITGLRIDETITSAYQGLFGYIGSSTSVTIRNVFLEGVYIDTTANYVGGLVASFSSSSSKGQILNCGVSGYIQRSGTRGFVGGLIGYSNYVSTQKSFSTVAITTSRSNGPYAGGLIGAAYNVSNIIKQCFYYSDHGVVGTTGKIGFIGYATTTSERNIQDIYTSANVIYIGNLSISLTNQRKMTDTSLWTSSTYGTYMHNTSMQVLKGVGNIYVEVTLKSAVYDSDSMTLSEETSSPKVYFYNILTGVSTGYSTFKSKSNYSFPLLEVEKYITDDNSSDSIKTLGSDYKISFGSSSVGSATYLTSARDLHSAQFVLTTSYTDSDGDIAIMLSNEDGGTIPNGYMFYLGNASGYYKVTLHERGVLLPVTFNFYEYMDVDAKTLRSPTRIIHDIQPVITYSKLYTKTDVFKKVEPFFNWGKSINSGLPVYIPYNEAYKISFSDTEAGGYIGMLSDWGSSVSGGNIVSGQPKIINASVKLRDENGVNVGDARPKEGKIYTSSDLITSGTTKNYYFNNIQPVTVKLYSSEFEKYYRIVRTYPVFVNGNYVSRIPNWTSSARNSTAQINVMVGENIWEKGFSIGNVYRGVSTGTNNVDVYCQNGQSSSFESLAEAGYYAPYWPEFCWTGFWLSESGTKRYGNPIISTSIGGSYGSNLTPSFQIERGFEWNFEYDSAPMLLAGWVPYKSTTNVNFALGNNPAVSVPQAESYNYIQTGTSVTLKNGEGITSPNLEQKFDRLSDQRAQINFTINQGYQLSAQAAISLTLANGSIRQINLSDLSDLGNYAYYSNYNNSNRLYIFIYNEIGLGWDQATNKVTVDFDHLMGITNICFKLEERTFNASYSATLQNDNGTSYEVMSLTIGSTKNTLRTNEPYEFTYEYGQNILFDNINIFTGFSFSNSLDGLKIYVNNSTTPVVIKEMFDVTFGSGNIELKSKTWNQENIQSFRIEFVLTRNSGNVLVNLKGLESQFYTTDNMIISLGNIVNSSSKVDSLQTSVSTGDTISFSINNIKDNFAVIQGIKVSMPGKTSVEIDDNKIGDNLSLSDLTLRLANFIIENSNDTVTIDITFKPKQAKVNVYKRVSKNGDLSDIEPYLDQNGNSTTGKTLTYNFEIQVQVSQDAKSLILNFVDINNSNNSFTINSDYGDPTISSIKIHLYRNVLPNSGGMGEEFDDITNISGTSNLKKINFDDGDTLSFVIDYSLRTSQVQFDQALVANNSTAISNTSPLQNHEHVVEYVVGDKVQLTAPQQNGYTFLGWYYVYGKKAININSGFTFAQSNLITSDSITIIAPGATPASNSEIVIQNYMYFIAVYEAKLYTLNFDTSQFIDEVNGQKCDVTLSNNSNIIVEFNTSKLIGGEIPVALLPKNPMYNFVGWKSGNIFELNYDAGTQSFRVPRPLTTAPSTDSITMTPMFEPKTVTLYYCDDDGRRTGETLSVVYGQKPTTTPIVPSARQGYTFAGWTYDGTVYYPYSNGQWGSFVEWKNTVLEANILPQWNAVRVNVKFHAGAGQFNGGVKEISGSVLYGSNNYIANGTLSTPTWNARGAEYEFAGYYIATYYGKEYIYNPSNQAESDICNFISEVTFYACYRLVSVDVSLVVSGQESASWVYNGQSYDLDVVIPSDLPFDSNMTISFQKDGKDIANSSIKDVLQSGVYSCDVTISGGRAQSNGVWIYTIGTVTESASLTVTISPKLITITQNGTPTNTVTKVFDNNLNVPGLSYTGVVLGDNVTVSIQYVDKNVGTNKEMTVVISGISKDNYYVDEIVGEITPYVVTYTVSGSSYKVGADNEKITIASSNISLNSDSNLFLSQIGAKPSIELQTSRNVVGTYTYNGSTNKIEVVSFNLIGANIDLNNFTYSVLGQYELVDAGSEEVVIQIRLMCDDQNAPSVASLGTISVIGVYSQISGNNSQNVYVIDSKSHFESSSLFSLMLSRDVNYWVDRVMVNNVEANVSINSTDSVDNITYTISDISSGSIIIDIYITTLSNITLDYDLTDGESLPSGAPTTTKYAYQKTIDYSISKYGAVLPTAQDINRVGFVLTGWKIQGSDRFITTSTIWSYKSDVVLVAQYTIASIDAKYYVDDVMGEIVNGVSNYSSIYDAVAHNIEYRVANENSYAINYTYSWKKGSAITSNTTNKLTVTNVTDSDTYTLTIYATSKQNAGVNTSSTLTLNVVITPRDLFANGYVITKQYDGTEATSPISILIVGQEVSIVGAYTSKNVGSGLDEDYSNWTINGQRADSKTLNFALNLQAVDRERSVITKKDVNLTVGIQTKIYDEYIFSINGKYTDKTPFNYTISTISSNVGIYTQENDGLDISITGDIIDNFNITISGSLEITEVQVDITWSGLTNVTFDAKYHNLTPIIPQFVEIVAIKYTNGEDTFTYDSIEENQGVYDAGVYTVTVEFENSNNNYEITSGESTTLTILKRTIYVDYDGMFNEKYYDGTTDVVFANGEEKVANIYNNFSSKQLLSAVITDKDAMPKLVYTYSNPKAGDNKEIIVSLEDDTNYSISASHDSLVGKIKKLDTVIYINAQKTYDAQKDFVVAAQNNQITATNIIDGENITGSVTFRDPLQDVLNVGHYDNSNAFEYDISLIIGQDVYSTNYNVVSVEYNLVINKAQVLVSTNRNKEYEYSGQEVVIEYVFANSQNSTIVPNSENVVFEYFANSGSTLDDGKAVQVGGYTFKMSLINTDADNFDISGDISNIPFSIVPREILIQFTQKTIEFEYQNSVVTYKKDQGEPKGEHEQLGYDRNIISQGYSLGVGDVLDWSFTTVDSKVGTYYINNDQSVSKTMIVTKNGIDYTKNYQFSYHIDSSIMIRPQSINFNDITLVESTSEYNGLVKTITIEFFDKYYNENDGIVSFSYGDSDVIFEDFTVSRDNGVVTSIQTPNDIIYAGTYTFGISLTNYIVSNKGTFTYTITKSRLDLKIGQLSKVYDGTFAFNNVSLYDPIEKGGAQGQNGAPYIGDDISVVGTYAQKDVGQNIALKFVLDSTNSLVMGSYYIDIQQNYYGSITQKEIKLELRQGIYQTYYIGTEISIDIDNFDKLSSDGLNGLVNNEQMSGELNLPVANVGSYDLSTLSNIEYDIAVTTYVGESSPFSNYLITGISGTVVIRPAQVVVTITETSKIYDGTAKSATFEYISNEGFGQIVESEVVGDIQISYTNESGEIVTPIDAGTYKIAISVPDKSNYLLIDGAGNAVSSYTSGQVLEISKRNVLVDVNYTHVYDGNVATYQILQSDVLDPTSNAMGGLVQGHSLTGVLKTNSAEAKRYVVSNIEYSELDSQSPIYTENLKIEIISTSTDVTSNYEITINANILIIADIQNINSDNINSIEYCAQDVTKLATFKITFDFGGESYEVLYDNSVTFGDGYTAVLNGLAINQGDGTFQDISEAIEVGQYRVTLNVTNEDDELSAQDKYIEFTIYQHAITEINGDFDKYYDGKSDVINQLSSPQIYSSDVDKVTIVGYYTQNSQPIFTVGRHAISFALDGEKAHNYTVSLENSIFGSILKQPIILSLLQPITVHYKGEQTDIQINKFEALKSNDTSVSVAGLINSLDSSTISVIEVNAGEYQLESLYAQNQIRTTLVDQTSVLDNYEIVGFDGTFTIKPCEIEVMVDGLTTIYSAQQQGISYMLSAVSSHGSIVEADRQSLITINYNGSAERPVNAGSYEITALINEDFTQNYVISKGGQLGSQFNYGTFTIQKREIAINIGTDKEVIYTGEQVAYTLTTDDVVSTQTVPSGLVSTHTVAGYYLTSGSEIDVDGVGIVYEIGGTTYYLTLHDFDILQDGISVLDNYHLVSEQGSLHIIAVVAGTIDDSYLQNLVYSATDYAQNGGLYVSVGVTNRLMTFVYGEDSIYGSLTNLKSVVNGQEVAVTEARNAGTYRLYLTINNTDTKNKPIDFTIAPKQITAINYTHDKNYDGQSNILGEITSSQIYDVDKSQVIILGNYVDSTKTRISTKGDHYVEFTFSGNGEMESNYSLPNYLDNTGSILARDIYLTLTQGSFEVYYTNESIQIDASLLSAYLDDTDEIISQFTSNVSGNIVVGLFESGQYDLSNNFEQIDIQGLKSNNSGFLDNYNIVAVNGTLYIQKAEVVVAISDYEKVYNGEVQTPTYTLSIFEGHGKLVQENIHYAQYLLDGAQDYIASPINVGSYEILLSIQSQYVSNYTLNFNSVNVNSYTANEKLIISQKDVTITVNPQPYQYSGSQVVYSIQGSDVTGLVTGHTLTGTLTTNGYRGGVYTFNGSYVKGEDYSTSDITPNITITSTTSTTTSNYNIQIIAQITIISSLTNFDTSKLSGLVYDGEDKVEKGDLVVMLTVDDQVKQFVFGTTYTEATFSALTYSGESTQPTNNTAIYAGEYSFIVEFDINGSQMEQTVSFIISPKTINQIFLQNDKTYDATINVLGEITSQDILENDDVSISGTYASSNAGTHDITLELSGEDAFNYVLNANLGLRGTINYRAITLQVTNNVVYTGNNAQILVDNLTVGGDLLVGGQQLSGYIILVKVNAGTYDFSIQNIDISNFKILDDDVDVTVNYSITYQGQVVIDKMNLTLVVDEIDLTYNGQIQSIDTFLSFEEDLTGENLSTTIIEEARLAIGIEYDKTPLNAGEYHANVSSTSNNFVITYQDDNVIDFTIKKRDIQIDIGQIVYDFNPTSTHETQFDSSYLKGLVEGQVVSGSFELSKQGLGVGTYVFNENPDNENPGIVIVTLSIIVNNENILDLNYNLQQEKLGSIEIIPFKLSSSQVSLSQSQISYRGEDISSYVTVNFRDANGILMSITSENNTYGYFVITGDLNENNEAVNVGNYTVNVTIPNYELENSQFPLEITHATITNVSFVNDKTYDGNAYVYDEYGRTTLSSSSILAADRNTLRINGYYVEGDDVTSSIGVHTIRFEFTEPDGYPALNYVFNIDEVGEILPKQATIEINHNFAYSASGNYVLSYEDNSSEFVSTGILDTQSLSGQISISGLTSFVGVVVESQINTSELLIIDENQNNVTSNYTITFVSNIEIVKAQISISFDGIATEYTYSNSQVVINPEFTFVNSTDSVSTDFLLHTYAGTKHSSEEAPKDVDTYTVTFEVKQDLASYYEIVSTNSFVFVINQFNIELQSGDIPNDKFFKQYNQPDPELIQSITSQFGEIITITFTRESGEEIGNYNLIISEWDNQNYNITAAMGALDDLFKITRAGSLDIVILNTPNNVKLLQKVYDNRDIGEIDISTLDFEASNEIVTGTIMFQEGVNVGSYSIGTGHNLQNANYETFKVTSEVEFVITPKPIKLSVINGDKDYDASNAFLGIIQILDEKDVALDAGIFALTASATFKAANVGDNIELEVTYSGDNIQNYQVLNTISANITKRNVTITPTLGQRIVYGTKDYTITYQIVDNGTSNFTGIFENELSGQLSTESYDAGSWPILSSLTSTNLQISFTSDIMLTITPKQLTVTSSDNFQKVYDTTREYNGELEVEGVIEGDVVNVVAYYDSADVGNRVVSFVLSGADKDNYFADDVLGVISERGVVIKYMYVVDGFEMINQNLIENTSRQQDNLIYGAAISTSIGSLPIPSHEGYDFGGWYLDKEYNKLITDDTVIDGNIWSLDESEKTAYAKWTIKQFNLSIVVATRVNGTYVVDSQTPGGTHQNINGLYDYGSVVSLQGLATANYGYSFVGYSSDLLLTPDESLLQNGVNIGASDVTLYAKFSPLTVVITLDSNGGVFETNVSGWTLNSTNTTATREVDFNSALGVALPQATKIGYKQDITVWENQSGDLIELNADTIIDEDFNLDTTLLVHYVAEKYTMVLDANGGYFENVDTSVWKIDKTNGSGNATVISKQVTFNSPVGEIIIPVRSGYEFANWSTLNFDKDYIWQSVTQQAITANWNEMQFDVEITSNHGVIEYQIVDSSLQVVEIGNVDNTTKTIQLMTTNRLMLSVESDEGYTFTNWHSDNLEINKATSTLVSTYDDLIQNYFVEAVFEANDNVITIVVNQPTRGYVTAGEVSTDGTTSSIEVTKKTGETLEISAYANEGYALNDWLVTGNGDVIYTLSGMSQDTTRTLSDFVGDLTVTVYFVPASNNITISADEKKGTIQYMLNDEQIEVSGSYTANNILTESTFEFDIVALHGYKIDLDLQKWLFDTTSQNKGDIDVQSTDGGYTAHITFTGFTSSGTIVVPFVNDEFTVTVEVLLKQGSNLTEFDTMDIVSLQKDDILSLLSTGDSFTGEYLSQVTLSPQDTIDGYNFYMWSVSSDKVETISASTGLIAFTEDGDLVYSIVDDMTLYLVYEIESFDVTFVVNDSTMGWIVSGASGNTTTKRTVAVNYGYNSPEITAVCDEYFEFEKWVRVELVDGEYVEYLVDGNPVEYFSNSIIVENVTEDCTYMAVFVGVEMSFSVSLILPDEDVFTEDEIDFASLEVVDTNSASIQSVNRDKNTLTYIINTVTGNDIDFVVKLADGYEYEGILTMDPRVVYNISRGENELTFSLENLYLETIINLSVRAKVYKINFNIIGQQDGAEIYPLTNVNGIVSYEYSNQQHTLIVNAKKGSSVQSILYILTGYKMVENPYFELSTAQTTENSVFSETYLGTLSSVGADLSIDVEIKAKVYSVTFDLDYADAVNKTTTSIVSHGDTTFEPPLTSEFTNPVRYGYKFLGYTTINIASSENLAGTTYYFDEGGIYSYITQNEKVYGFRGSEYAVDSLIEGIDYELTLYATWEQVRYEVELVFVPSMAIDQTSLNYNEIFPMQSGKYNILDGNNLIVGVEYTPGSEIIVNAPKNCFTGYSYYGWSYVDGITSRTDENLSTQSISLTMGEEKVTIYLYYGLEINASATEGGSATVSTDVALYGEIVTITATNDYGYIFDHWLQNSSEIKDSTITMEIEVSAPTTFVAVFIGEKIDVRVNQVDHAELTYKQGEYRVGDTVTLTISVSYGYEHRGWASGGYSGTIRPVSGDDNSFTYTIVPDDFTRGYVTFELVVGAKSIDVRFSIVGDGDCGDILVDNSSVAQQTKSFVYDNTLNFIVDVYARYELVSLTLNGTPVQFISDGDKISAELLINQMSGFTCDATNEIVATYRKMLWTDDILPFTGSGTESNPYLIQNAKQLASIAYLINNNVAVAVGSTAYKDAYYFVTSNIDLSEKFWVPIGTEINPFNGTFDLNGYQITELEADDWNKVNARPNGMPYGLFGYIGENAKFITGNYNYTLTLIIIFSVLGAIILIVLLIILILMLRRRKMRRMSASSTLGNDIMSQEELLKAQKIQSKCNSSKKK